MKKGSYWKGKQGVVRKTCRRNVRAGTELYQGLGNGSLFQFCFRTWVAWSTGPCLWPGYQTWLLICLPWFRFCLLRIRCVNLDKWITLHPLIYKMGSTIIPLSRLLGEYTRGDQNGGQRGKLVCQCQLLSLFLFPCSEQSQWPEICMSISMLISPNTFLWRTLGSFNLRIAIVISPPLYLLPLLPNFLWIS